MRWFTLSFALFGCADYSMSLEAWNEYAPSDIDAQRTLRLDVIPSNASADLLPQSFWIEENWDWQNIDIELNESTTIEGTIYGFTIYPYADITLPGETVPVESQVSIEMSNKINGAVINSDEDGYFSLTIPSGVDYQMSIAPLSPQNVPYLVMEDLRFASESAPMEIDLGAGIPIYGRIVDFDPTLIATAQLIDTQTQIKGPKVDIMDNGYFQLRAPHTRSEFTIRIQGSEYSLFPTMDIPVQLAEEDTDGFRADIEVGELDMSTVFGRVVDSNMIPYSERCTIRFESIELFNSTGHIAIETNNDVGGHYSTTLVEGRYKVSIIPPYSEDIDVAPTSLELTVDSDRIPTGDLVLPSPVTVSGNIVGLDGLPSDGTVVQFTDVNFEQRLYSTTTDPQGRFSLKLPPVLMNTSIIPPSSSSAIQNFQTDLRSYIESFEWSLQTGQPLSGVISFEGSAVPFSMIEVFQGDRKLATGLTGENGEFELQIQVEE